MTRILTIVFLLISLNGLSQTGSLHGRLESEGLPVGAATIRVHGISVISDSTGIFSFPRLPVGTHFLYISRIGFINEKKPVTIIASDSNVAVIQMKPMHSSMEEVVVTGTLKEVRRIESPVPVEVYSPAFFRKNPTPNIFDALQNVNGVRPQLNCNVCNTGDIHINGLEGPYTMVLIDGMPIVSSLSTVYGLSGIPNSLVERIEIVKGPASSLYGSEAVGGLINIITKNPESAPKLSSDIMVTSWKELNADLGFRIKAGKYATGLAGINYFNYNNPRDENGDNFTDVTLQNRISVFQKWNIKRNNDRIFNIAARYFYEDRWGGELNWNKGYRGGDSVYGESIYTRRWEVIGNYQLPVRGKMVLSFSLNDHDQDSRYGTTSYIARQQIAFSQLTIDTSFGKHDILAGAALRYTKYDDNTAATFSDVPETWLPGIFVQDEISLGSKHKLLLGMRYDHNSVHGNIFTPRIAYKYKLNNNNIFRLNAGTGYRVVNLFTEDHAALTGAREVVVKSALKPERTYNVNLNYLKKIHTPSGNFIGIELSSWLTYFNNRITADYLTDPDKIIYDNLDGFAISRGISANIDIALYNGIKILAGTTFQDVYTVNAGIKTPQLLTEKFTGTWAVSYKIKPIKLTVDYTGNVYGPMLLPLLGSLDPRPASSPAWSLQNIQFTYAGLQKAEIYFGVKNLLNWTPTKHTPFIIARSNDPFDKTVEYTNDGKIKATDANPYALTFDPNYLYAPNQGLRLFAGFRVTIR